MVKNKVIKVGPCLIVPGPSELPARALNGHNLTSLKRIYSLHGTLTNQLRRLWFSPSFSHLSTLPTTETTTMSSIPTILAALEGSAATATMSKLIPSESSTEDSFNSREKLSEN